MNTVSLLYEGKAKKVYTTENANQVIVQYKDDATAFNGQKKGTIKGKGVINNLMTNFLFQKLEERGIPTHYVQSLSNSETLVKKVNIIPLEVIIRNKAAGSFAKKMGLQEGMELQCPILELSYKDDNLGDPMINEYMALALGIATREELNTISELAFHINEELKIIFYHVGIELIDFKLEFGYAEGNIILADEISPDTCRLWDIETHKNLDKDRFRKDLGNVEDAYQEVFQRLQISLDKI